MIPFYISQYTKSKMETNYPPITKLDLTTIGGTQVITISLTLNGNVLFVRDNFPAMTQIMESIGNLDIAQNYEGNLRDASSNPVNFSRIFNFAENKKLRVYMLIRKNGQTRCFDKNFGDITLNEIQSMLDDLKIDYYEQSQQIQDLQSENKKLKSQNKKNQKEINKLNSYIVYFIAVILSIIILLSISYFDLSKFCNNCFDYTSFPNTSIGTKLFVN